MLTLADARPQLTLTDEAVDLYSPQNIAANRARKIDASTQFGRGWESAGLSEEGGALLDAANNAYRKGDNTLGQALEQQGRDKMSQAQQWAPTVRNFTDIKGLGQAMDWLGGSAGNLRTSVAPAIGGLAGGAIGSLLGPAGTVAGSFLGSSLAGYETEANEAIGGAMLDPEIRAKRSMQEIKDAGRVKGAINAGLEALVPAGIGGALFKPAEKALAGQALKTVGKAAGIGVGEEFGTEAAQSLVGQGTENYLKDKPLTDFDYKQAFNEGMAGAVAGGGMGAVGGGVQALKAKVGVGTDKVAEVASDPIGAVAYQGGKVTSGIENWLNQKLDPEVSALKVMSDPKATPEQRAEAAKQHMASVMQRPDATQEDRERAAKYADQFENYADAVYLADHDKQTKARLKSIDDELKFLDEDSKQSLMGAQYDPYADAASMNDSENKPYRGVTRWVGGKLDGGTPGSDRDKTAFGETVSGLAKLWLDQDGQATRVFKHANPEDGHFTATKLMAWVASGFGKELNDGKPFVPESLVDSLGDHATKTVESMYKLAKAQGIYTGSKRDLTDVVQHLSGRYESDVTDSNMIRKLLTPLAKAGWNDHDTTVWMNHLRKSKGKVDDVNAETLRELFGPNTDKLLAHFTPASQEKRNEAAGARKKTSSPLAAGMEEEGGRTVVSNKLGDETLGAEAEQHNTGMGEISVQRNAPVFEGAGDKPLNTKYDDRKRELGEKLQHYAENPHLGKDVREVGAWDAVKEKHADDPMALYKAEDALIKTHGKDVGVGKGATEADARQHMLTQINKQFRYVRVQDKDVAAKQDKPSALHVEDIETLREKPKGEYSKNVTPEHGMLYLGRKATVDKETGEIQGKDEWFQTSAHKLLGHAWKALGKEGEVNDAEGARAHYENVLQAVSALMASDPSFTGKIGVRNAAGVGVKTVTELPGNFKLSKSATVADALKQIKKESTKQDGPTHQEKVRTLQRVYLENSSDDLGYLDAHIRHALDDGSTSVVDKVYNEVNGGKWNDHDIVGDVVGENGKQEALKVLSKREDPAGDEPIHRTSDGARAGSEGYGYEGNSRGGKEGSGVESRSQADKTKGDKHATQGPVDKAAQWAFDAIRKGMPSFAAALKKMSEVQLELLQQGLQQLSSMSIKGIQDNWASMSTSEAKRILFYATNAVLHLKNHVELVNGESNGRSEAQGAAGKSGQGDAVGRSEGEGGVPSSDRSRGSARTHVDAEEGRAAAVRSEAGVQDAGTGEGRKGSLGNTERNSDGAGDNAAGQGLGGERKLTASQLDEAVLNDNYDSFDSVAKLHAFAKAVSSRLSEINAKDEDGTELTDKESELWGPLSGLVSEARRWLKNPNEHSGTDFEMWVKEVDEKATDADVHRFVEALAGKQNEQSTSDKQATKEEVAAAREEIQRTLGDNIKLAFKKNLGGISGNWHPGAVNNSIEIALNSDVLGTAFHESMHEFFNILKKHGDASVRELMQRVATTGPVMHKLRQLLAHHPEALKQLSDPEEAAAYMYQFWRAGQLKLGPQTEGVFAKIKNFFSSVLKLVTNEMKDEQQAEKIMQAFSSGVVKDTGVRQAVVEAMNKDMGQHAKNLQGNAEAWRTVANRVGKYFYSASGMMEASNNPHVKKLVDLFDQGAGKAMKTFGDVRGSFFDAVPREKGLFINKFENILTGLDKKDVELVREALSTGKASNLPEIQEVVDAIHAFNKEFGDYITKRNVERLNEDGQWEAVKMRKDFGLPQVWDTEAIMKNPKALVDNLLEHHQKELQAIADEANKEIERYMKDTTGKVKRSTLGPAAEDQVSDAELRSLEQSKNGIGAKMDVKPVTVEMVADQIVKRIINASGKVDISENMSDLGISPMARSVNRRSLSWINKEVFDKYMEKDLVNIYSSYITSMVKRAEYGARFGRGGEKIRDAMDAAFLHEMGGEKLVTKAQTALPAEIEAWKKAKAKDPANFSEPYPTLRSVGVQLHHFAVTHEEFQADALRAAKVLEHPQRAVQAMEGTLGMDITNAMRNLNSMLITYQSVRLLSTSLFTSLSDVMGITLNGGTLNDAWEAFTRGIREVKLSAWDDTKSTDAASQRAEMWGSVDAATFSDAIGQGYGSMYLSGKAKAFSDKFFKKIGMEGWNRGMRIAATQVAERIITDWHKNGINVKDKAEVARFERLFGEGAQISDIKMGADGKLDINDEVNRAAVSRFVNDAVLRPNASQRTIWGSDPHFAALWHLKSFTYAFHKVMIEGVLKQAALGNYRPALVMATGYMPVIIGADAVKELLIPGDEPPWMKGGLGDFMAHGIRRAGIGGIPQLVYESGKDPASWFGPTTDEIQGMLSVPFFQDKTLAGEALGALPLGNIARRAAA